MSVKLLWIWRIKQNLKEVLPCEIVVELFALFLCVFEDCSDRADNGKDEAAKGNRAQVKDLDRVEHLPKLALS